MPKDGYHGASAWRSISPSYFKVFQIPLLRGRFLNDGDREGTAPVMLINETMATRFWPNGDPIGERVTIDKGAGPPFTDEFRQIVGIVGDVRDDEPDRSLWPTMYVPVAQVPDGLTAIDVQNLPMMWVVRTKAAPYSLSAAVQRELRAASGGLAVGHLRPMEQVIAELTTRQSFSMLLMTVFSASALVLAAVGVYGLIAYSLRQRTHEIGIRMALGAKGSEVLWMMAGQGIKLALLGVGAGLASALMLARFLSSLLYGVTPTDPLTFAGVIAALLGVSLFASFIPARRATKVDPTVALRYE